MEEIWHLIKEEKEYLDINGNVMDHVPQYCDMYALGSYGIVGKNVQKAIICKREENSHNNIIS